MRTRRFLASCFAALCLVLGVINCQYYLVDFPNMPYWQYDDMLTETYAANRILELPPDTTTFVSAELLGNYYVDALTYGRRSYQRLNWPVADPFPLLYSASVKHIAVLAGGRLDYAGQSDGRALMDELRYYYPCGQVDQRRNKLDEVLVWAFTADQTCIRQGNGLRVNAAVPQRSSGTSHVPLSRVPVRSHYVANDMTGTLVVTTAGTYSVSVEKAPGNQVMLDGRRAVDLRLLPGLYELRVRQAPGSMRAASLIWKVGESIFHRIPPAQLLARGLPPWGVRATYTFSDGTSLNQWWPTLLLPATGSGIRGESVKTLDLQGAVFLPEDGVYQFNLQSSSRSTLAIAPLGSVPADRSHYWVARFAVPAAVGWHHFMVTIDKPVIYDLRAYVVAPSGTYFAVGGLATLR